MDDNAFTAIIIHMALFALVILAGIFLFGSVVYLSFSPTTTSTETIDAIYPPSSGFMSSTPGKFTTTQGGYYTVSETAFGKIKVGKTYLLYLRAGKCYDATESP